MYVWFRLTNMHVHQNYIHVRACSNKNFIGVSLSKPHTTEFYAFLSIYVHCIIIPHYIISNAIDWKKVLVTYSTRQKNLSEVVHRVE